MRRMKGAIAIAAVALFLSGCGQYKALPTEERYQFINQVKDGVDLPSAGEVTSESYDNGEGLMSPSWFKAEIKGEQVFETLRSRIKGISGVSDCRDTMRQLTCRKGQVDIFLAKSTTEPKAEFILNDSSSGRTSK
jgi:hypothetical protein